MLLLLEEFAKMNDRPLRDVGARLTDRGVLSGRRPATLRHLVVCRTCRLLPQARDIARDVHHLGADARQFGLPVLFLVSVA